MLWHTLPCASLGSIAFHLHVLSSSPVKTHCSEVVWGCLRLCENFEMSLILSEIVWCKAGDIILIIAWHWIVPDCLSHSTFSNLLGVALIDWSTHLEIRCKGHQLTLNNGLCVLRPREVPTISVIYNTFPQLSFPPPFSLSPSPWSCLHALSILDVCRTTQKMASSDPGHGYKHVEESISGWWAIISRWEFSTYQQHRYPGEDREYMSTLGV
jgi:hypothetical protein